MAAVLRNCDTWGGGGGGDGGGEVFLGRFLVE